MSGKPDPFNPYESPRLHTSEDARQIKGSELDRLVRRADVTFDILVVVLSIAFSAILGEIGTDLARQGAEYGGLYIGAGARTVCWTAWAAGIVVRVFVQIVGGWMLGRFLRRLNLGLLIALIAVCLVVVAVWFIASWSIMPLGLDRHFYVFLIGYQGYVVQVVLSTLAALGAVVGGAWMGRRSQQAADLKRAPADSPCCILSSLYATFTVGQRELHEVGVLFTAGGREIITVDGEKKLDRRSFALRGSRCLTVGDDERHDVKIEWNALPLISTRVFVDGQRDVEELFPDLRLLSKVIATVLSVLAAIAVIMALVLVLMMTL